MGRTSSRKRTACPFKNTLPPPTAAYSTLKRITQDLTENPALYYSATPIRQDVTLMPHYPPHPPHLPKEFNLHVSPTCLTHGHTHTHQTHPTLHYGCYSSPQLTGLMSIAFYCLCVAAPCCLYSLFVSLPLSSALPLTVGLSVRFSLPLLTADLAVVHLPLSVFVSAMLSNAAALLQLPQGIGAGSGDRAAPESPASLTHESPDVFNELD